MCATKRKRSMGSRRRSKKSPLPKWTALLAIVLAAAAWLTQSEYLTSIYDMLDITPAPSVSGGVDSETPSSESITDLPLMLQL